MKDYLAFFLLVSLLFGCQSNAEKENENVSKDNQTSSPINSNQTAEYFAEKAHEQLYRQNIKQAQKFINQGMALDTGLAELRAAKGELHYLLNQGRYAKNEWEICLKIDPKNKKCLSNLAELSIAITDYERALELTNTLIEIDNNNAQAYFMKGIIVRDLKNDTGLALQYFQNAIDIKQDYVEAIDLVAVTLAQRGDTLAKFYYQRLLEMNPNDALTYFKLGVFYMQQNKFNRALENYTKAVQLNPKDVDSYYNMGFMHLNIRQFATARDYFSRAIAVEPERAFKSYYGRGYAQEMLGDVLNARKDYRKALEILPMHTPSQKALSRVNGIINR